MKKLSLNLTIVLFFTSILTVNTAFGKGTDRKEDSHTLNIGIPSFAMVHIASEGSTTVDFNSVVPENAGDIMTFSQESTSKLWLNYSSIVGSGKTNTISAKATSLPAGVDIEVVVSGTAATGKKGKTGAGQTATLTTQGVTVVNNIGSCYTGFGESKGHELTYKLSANETNYDKIVSDNSNITVTYTITEN